MVFIIERILVPYSNCYLKWNHYLRKTNAFFYMSTLAPCPACRSPYCYEMNGLLICPECGHEWKSEVEEVVDQGFVVKDSNGNILKNGDTVITIKNLPVKGSSQTIKAGTKVKSIRLVNSDHNIDCKIDGFGAMALKSEFLKKV